MRMTKTGCWCLGDKNHPQEEHEKEKKRKK